MCDRFLLKTLLCLLLSFLVAFLGVLQDMAYGQITTRPSAEGPKNTFDNLSMRTLPKQGDLRPSSYPLEPDSMRTRPYLVSQVAYMTRAFAPKQTTSLSLKSLQSNFEHQPEERSRRRRWLVVLVIVTGAIAAYYYISQQEEEVKQPATGSADIICRFAD